jgi:hypothetical protein
VEATTQADPAAQVGVSVPQPPPRPDAAQRTLRLAAGLLAANRIAFGTGFLAAPRLGGAAWIGRTGGRAQTTVLTRALGARDVALGAGGLLALARGSGAGAWFGAAAFADATDAVAALLAREALSDRSLRLTLAMGGGSAVVGAAAAIGLR